MLTRQTNIGKEVLFYVDFYSYQLLNLDRESRTSRVKQGREFSEILFGLMLTRQTNVRKEVLFYVDFQVWVGKVGKVG